MDISKLDFNFLELFAMYYSVSCNVFDCKPEEQTHKKQAKIRKWIQKTYINGNDFPDNIKNCLSNNVRNTDFFHFLKDCFTLVEKEGTKQEQLFNKAAVDLTQEARQALSRLLEFGCRATNIILRDNDACIKYADCSAYSGFLILKNITDVSIKNADYINFDGVGTFTKNSDGYRLIGLAEDWENDTEFPVTFNFSDVQVKTEVYNATTCLFNNTPWLHLVEIGADILDKQTDLYGYELNEKEKVIQPLLEEIKLIHWIYGMNENSTVRFPMFKTYLKNFGYKKILKNIEKLENNYSDDKKKRKIINKLIFLLNQNTYEPLWREIYNKIADSQTEYPIKTDFCCNKNNLNKIREDIQQLMESHGYSGNYPDFIKIGNMKKIHIAESYGLSYFTGMEKNVQYHIHCIENYYDDQLTVQFLYGTAFSRKNNAVKDTFSCTFNAKGKRFYGGVLADICFDKENGRDVYDKISQKIRMAVKKTEFIKLTKEERNSYDGAELISVPLLLLGGLFMGLFFGIFMTLGLMLITVVLTVLFSSPQEIPEILKEMPWLPLFIFSCVGFAVPMTIVEFIAQRK